MPTSTEAELSLPDFSVYVTHGASLTIKGLAKSFSQKKQHIQAHFKDGFYVLMNKAELLTMMDSDEVLPERFTPDEFNSLVQRIKEQCFLGTPLTMLCVDSNLGHPAGAHINDMALFFECVAGVLPHILIPFSDTPESVENARAYLNGEPMVIESEFTNIEYRLPAEVIVNVATDRAGLVKCISKLLRDREIIAGIYSFFSSKHGNLVKLDEIKKRTSSNDTTVASNDTSLSVARNAVSSPPVESQLEARSSSLDEVMPFSEKAKTQPERTLWKEFVNFCLFRRNKAVVVEQVPEIEVTKKNRTGY